MIGRKELIGKLRILDLNSYEAKLWTALLSRGVSSAGELSEISSVPRSRTYDILESLERKGFILSKPGRPLKFMALPPIEVMEKLKKVVYQEAAEKEKIYEEMKKSDLLKQLDDLFQQGIELVDPTEKTAVLKGRDSIYHHLAFMMKNAKKNVLLVTTKEGLKRKQDQFSSLFEKIKNRKVNVKILAPENREIFSQLSSSVELKPSDFEGMLCIVDEKEILLLLTDDRKIHQNYDTAIWLDSPYLAKFIKSAID